MPAAPVRAFTLVELLTVIGIIALLVAMLTPTLDRAKFLTRRSVCVAHLDQFGNVAGTYAAEHRQFFPRQDLGGTGRNLWDVSNDFYHLGKTYGMPHEMFFCVTSPESLVKEHYKYYGWFTLIGYMYWVPRKFGSIIGPPDPGDPNYVVLDTEVFRGPISAVDAYIATNPLMTDVVGVSQGADQGSLLDTNLQRDRNPWMTSSSAHQWRQRLDSSNQVFGDGHVRTVPGNELRVRFLGNWWNFR